MIELKNITKKSGNTKWLNGLNLIINEHELFGFVGPIGSGKTTAIKIMSGLLAASSGAYLIDGMDMRKNPKKLKSVIGYVPEEFGIYENLKVDEYLSFFASAYGMTGKKKEYRIEEMVEMLNLSEFREQFVENLPRNGKKRLCIARSLIHDPQILLLDEPFSGLSIQTRIELEEILRQLNSLGTTVVISAHTMHEVIPLCTGIAVFNDGKVTVKGSMKEISNKITGTNPLVMKVGYGYDKAVQVLKAEEKVKNLIISEENEIMIHFNGNSQEEGELLKKVVMAGALVISFSRKGGDMDTVFREKRGKL